jgi:asparagine synthase (glutamine-hydrolysing)
MTARMGAALQSEPGLALEERTAERYGGGRVSSRAFNPEPQPLLTGSRVTWFDGEVFHAADSPGRTPTADEIAGWLDDSGRALAALDGVFSLASFDAEAGELVLATDRLGFRPLYVTETADWLAYASRVGALLAIRDRMPALDAIALRQFFAFDHLLGDRTWWQGIEVVPPGSRWRISATGRQAQRYWTFDDIPFAPLPAEEVIPEMARLWAQAVRQRRKPGLTPLLLSGGLDSRSLLAELRRQGAPVATITFGAPRCPDMVIARRCARLAGVPHEPRALDAGTWWHGRDAGIAQTDGLINAMHLHAASAREAETVGNRVSPVHIAGDSLFGGSYLADYLIPSTARAEWRESWRDIVRGYCKPNPFFRAAEVVEASGEDVGRYLEGRSPDCFFYLHRQRRLILHGTIALSPRFETTYPSLSLPLIDLLLGKVAPEDRKDHRLYARFLLAEYPEYFATIPWQATGRPVAAPPPTTLGRIARRLLGRAPWLSPSRSRRPFADYGWLVRVSGLQQRLARQSLLVEDALGPAARSALATDALDARVLLGLVTLETYLRQATGAPPLPGAGRTAA